MRKQPALLAPLAFPVFRSLWLASMVSNLGTMMHAVGAAWLMTSLTTSPFIVSLVPFCALAPTFLVGLIGGALADMLDRRRWLILTQSWMSASALALGLLAIFGDMTPTLLLALTFCLGIGNALNLPCWQAIIQDIVPKKHVAAAVSLNSMSFNTARTLGPALGGIMVGAFGPASVFLFNAFSFSATVGVLFWWQNQHEPKIPRSLLKVLMEGVAYAVKAVEIRSALIRVSLFCLFSSSIWALLPLVARERLQVDPLGYGLLLAAFGIGSLCGGSLVPGMRRRMSPDAFVGTCMVFFSAALAGLANAGTLPGASVALFVAGACWVGILINFNVSVQIAVPSALRGRAMSCYLVMFQGSFAVGAACAGSLASAWGLANALFICAAGTFLGVALIPFLPLPVYSFTAETQKLNTAVEKEV